MDVYFNSGSVPWAPIPHSELGENVPPHVNFRGTKYPVTKYYDGRMERPYQPGIPLNTVKCIVTGAPLGRLGHVAKTQSHMRPSHTKAMLGDKKLKVIDAKYKVLPAYQMLLKKINKVDEEKALNEFYRAIRYVTPSDLSTALKTYRKNLWDSIVLKNPTEFSPDEIKKIKKVIDLTPAKDIIGDTFVGSLENVFIKSELEVQGESFMKTHFNNSSGSSNESMRLRGENDQLRKDKQELEKRVKDLGDPDKKIKQLEAQIEVLQKDKQELTETLNVDKQHYENSLKAWQEDNGKLTSEVNDLKNNLKLFKSLIPYLKPLLIEDNEDVTTILKTPGPEQQKYQGKAAKLFKELNTTPEFKDLINNN